MANLSRSEKDAYDAALQEERDKIGMVALGRAEGRAAEGRAEGVARGEAQEKEKTALKMLAEGLDDALICKITGLSPDTLTKVASKRDN